MQTKIISDLDHTATIRLLQRYFSPAKQTVAGEKGRSDRLIRNETSSPSPDDAATSSTIKQES